MTKPFTPVMTFGKYRDKPINEVPSGYLKWALENFEKMNKTTRSLIVAHLEEKKSNDP